MSGTPQPTANEIPSTAAIILSDFVTGRIAGGHQSDYLTALEAAVLPLGAVTIAPYRDGYPDAAGRPKAPPTASRFGRYWENFCLFHKLLRKRQVQLILFPSPEFQDFVVFFLASILRVSKHTTVALFVFRRNSAGIVGRTSWKSRLIDHMVRWLAKRHYLYPISDSKVALTHWEAITGLPGSLVDIPVRRAPTERPPRQAEDPLTIGLIGLFRLEKGATAYDRVTEEALGLGPPTQVVLQLNPSNMPEEERLAAELRRKWHVTESVQIIDEHLNADAYASLLDSLDILVLPYDAASYGVGTSGIMFEMLAMDGVVVATRFEWGIARFKDNPNVVWMDNVEPATIQNALKEAAKLVTSGSRAQLPDNFVPSWHAAIQQALASLPKSRFDTHATAR